MSRRRFLVEPRALDSELVTLPPAEAAHARKVLRLSPGDQVQLIDGSGRRARAVLISLDKKGATCRVERVETLAPPRPRLVLCPGLLKGPAMDLLAVKLTELAVDQVRPLICARSVPKPKDSAAKLERWQRLVGQALKQCGAARAPEFMQPAPFELALDQAPAHAARLMLYEDETSLSLAAALAAAGEMDEVWALIGPEGGFEKEEVAQARAAGFAPCGLPHTILRAETAAIAVASVVRFGALSKYPS